MSIFLSSYRLLYLFTVLIMLVVINTSYGQFFVVSSSSAYGEVNVDTAATFAFTFNAAIDTTARFAHPGDFFMELYFDPDTAMQEPDSVTVSPDLRTVYIHNLHLSLSTVYRFIITNAVSLTDDSLDIPYYITFTTAPSMPFTATVSGSINYPSNDPAGAVVVLFDANPFEEDEEGEEGEIKNWTIVPASSGLYSIDYVDSSQYWPAVIKNFYIDEWGDIELKPGSQVGFLDENGDLRPDSIYVPFGANITGINMTLFEVYPQTARSQFSNLQTLAQSWSLDAIPVILGGAEINPDGTSLFWQYGFYSPSLMLHKGWRIMGDLIVSVILETSPADTLALPVDWLDSDDIMTISENNGGSDFRQQYSDAQTEAMCGSFYPGEDENNNLIKSLNRIRNPISTSMAPVTPVVKFNQIIPEGITDIPNQIVWAVSYYSDSAGTDMSMLIEPSTGEVLTLPVTAKTAEQLAYPIVQQWMSDAKLWTIGNQGTSVDPQGNSQVWTCIYYSPTLDSLHAVTVYGLLPVLDEHLGWLPPDTSTIPSDWLDSDVTIATAESNGGTAYRAGNENVYVDANLSRWYYGGQIDITVWQYAYGSSTSNTLIIYIDALTGNDITAIDDPQQDNLPNKFTLFQNYPNPFNPSTTIKYYLEKAGKVELRIYNSLGQLVNTLVKTEETAGDHSIVWNGDNALGKNMASGIFYYQLVTEDHVSTKKMILLR